MPFTARRFFVLVAFLGLVWSCQPAGARGPSKRAPLTREGKRLAAALDSLDVENYWLPGKHIGNWKTGEPDGKKGGPPTHCSLFVAGACWSLGVPMLPPPPQNFLSNRQQAWMFKEGKALGWRQVKHAVEAQRLANRGVVVVASYRNPNPKKAGHIAMVRPAKVRLARVEERGPRIAQSGRRNYRNTDVQTGFRAWAKGQVLFFAYRPGKE